MIRTVRVEPALVNDRIVGVAGELPELNPGSPTCVNNRFTL
jgi:hypothetical protein